MSLPSPPNERSLFVIEQQGKKRRLPFLLSEAGFTDFEVQPTYAVLFDLPADALAISPISLLVTGAARIFVMALASRLPAFARPATTSASACSAG